MLEFKKNPKFKCMLIVIMNILMKISSQCVTAVKKEKSMLGIIRKGIENKMASIILAL